MTTCHLRMKTQDWTHDQPSSYPAVYFFKNISVAEMWLQKWSFYPLVNMILQIFCLILNNPLDKCMSKQKVLKCSKTLIDGICRKLDEWSKMIFQPAI